MRILTTGSFLGQFDGMFEYPSHSADRNVTGLTPYGGLLGVETWLATPGNRRPGDLLLIAGDNPSHAFGDYLTAAYGQRPTEDVLQTAVDSTGRFYERLGRLKPTAIGLWSEDFFRALAPVPSPRQKKLQSNAGRFVAWLAANPSRKEALPTLASNAAVRFHADELNTIDAGDIELEIAEHQSIPWTDKLTLSVPCDVEDLAYALAARSHTEGADLAVEGTDKCHAPIKLKQALKPGRRYTLKVTHAGAAAVELSFSTDRALTPHVDGFPVIDPGASAPLVVALVDPGIRAQLPVEFWEWEPGSAEASVSQQSQCAPEGVETKKIEKCEIVLLDPKASFNTMRAWFSPKRERYFALISGLEDQDSRAVLDGTDLIKFTVLPNDTAMLGKGALATDDYSGSDGNFSIVDGGTAPATRVWARPEWIGETVVTMSANVSKVAAEWHLEDAHAAYAPVEGRRLCAVADNDRVEYFAAMPGAISAELVRDTGLREPIARERLYRPYVSDRTYDDRNKQGNLWIDRGDFAAMVLDRMRTELDAEVAIIPSETVDADYIAYFAAEHDEGHALDWMSRETVRRALFRAGRVVRARVSGSQLLSSLQSMASRAQADGKAYCIAGIGSTACGISRIDKEHLLINGRTIVPEHYYGVATTAGMAARFELKADKRGHDLVDIVDTGFKTGSGSFNTCDVPESRKANTPAHDEVEPLGARLEEAGASRVQSYVRFAPFDFTLANVELNEPVSGSFSQTTIEGRDAKDRRTLAVSTAVDMGLDWRRATLRAIGSLKQGRDRIEDPSTGAVIRSEDPDEYSIGGRLDWKVRPFAPSARLFVGGFIDGELVRDRFDDITPAPSGVRLRRYAYGTAGLEMDNLVEENHFKLRQVRLSLHAGRAYNERTQVRINDTDVFDLSGGLKPVLKAYTGTITSIAFEDVDGWRNRVELGTLVTVPFYKAFGRDAQLEVSAKGRYVFRNVSVELAEAKSVRSVWKLLFPVNRLFSVGFEADHHLAWSEQDQRFSVWRTKALLSVPIFTKRAAGFIW